MMLLCMGINLPGCSASKESGNPWPEAVKIKFRTDDIRPDGLRGPPDGLTSVAYEFCAPASAAVNRELLQIDPGLAIQPAASGRVGCRAGQSLVIGETGQPGWLNTLKDLSRLDYVEEIRECQFE